MGGQSEPTKTGFVRLECDFTRAHVTSNYRGMSDIYTSIVCSAIAVARFFGERNRYLAVEGKKGLSAPSIATEAHATEIGLRNRAGYCIFDQVPSVRNRPGFPIGLNY